MKIPHFNVAIIGSGITGLSTAYFLNKGGADRVCILRSPHDATSSLQSADLVAGGLHDNFTRISNAHGLDFAKEIWTFSNSGFDEVLGYCKEHKIAHHRNKRLRFIVTESELKEAHQAVREMQSLSLDGAIYPSSSYSFIPGLHQRVLAVQEDGNRAAWLDTNALLRSLQKESAVFEIPTAVQSFEKSKEGLTLNLEDGTELTTEFVVLACHQQIGKFLPSLKSALVTFADQWTELDLPLRPELSSLPGTVFSAHHGYEWGVILKDSVHYGGCRYLRKLAGFGATEASVDPRITEHLKGQLKQTFLWTEQSSFKKSTGLIDIWPCDELPLVGPMFGESRILLATGYMGTGISLGFQAGFCLSELIRTGDCPQLPRRLWPERLRSL